MSKTILRSKTILITGATGGLGTAVVSAAAAAGHRVLACGRVPRAEAPAACRAAGVVYTAADLTHEKLTEEMIARLTEEHGRIDAGFLLAGGFAMGDLAETDAAAIDTQVRLNFKTAYHVLRPLFAHMCTHKGGQLCVIGARLAAAPAMGGFAVAYTLAKGMLLSLAAVLEAEGKAYGVRTSVLVPSIIDTPANRAAMPEANPAEWVTAADIADALLLLISQKTHTWRENVLKLYHHA